MSKSSISLATRWSNLLINAIITLTMGAMLVFVPEAMYNTMILVVGVILLVSGIAYIIYMYRSHKLSMKNRFVLYGQAILNIAVGLLMLLQPTFVYKLLIYAISIWLILIGGFQLFLAPSQNKNSLFNPLLINSLISIGLGVLLFLWPQFPFQVLGYILGVISFVLFYYSYVLYRHRADVVTFTYENEEDPA
jgi:uncharacterized membrane protein HdeD (DUF308 family)